MLYVAGDAGNAVGVACYRQWTPLQIHDREECQTEAKIDWGYTYASPGWLVAGDGRSNMIRRVEVVILVIIAEALLTKCILQ